MDNRTTDECLGHMSGCHVRDGSGICPNCKQSVGPAEAPVTSNERLARLQTLAASSIVGDDLKWLLAQYESLVSVATPIAEALRQVGDESNWRDGDETDRVYAWHEIEPLWKALTGATRKPGCLRPVCAEEPGYCRRCSHQETVSLSTYESAVKGRADFREAYRNARNLVHRFVAAWESQPGHENMDRLCEIGRSLGTIGDDSTVSPANARFIECDTCRAKPGSPTLCAGCLHNRRVIESLTGRMTQARHAVETTAEPTIGEKIKRRMHEEVTAAPNQNGWHFWTFEDDEGEQVLAMMGPELQAASFSVPKGSIRLKVLRQFAADMRAAEKTSGKSAKCLVADCPEPTADGQAMCAEHMRRIEP